MVKPRIQGILAPLSRRSSAALAQVQRPTASISAPASARLPSGRKSIPTPSTPTTPRQGVHRLSIRRHTGHRSCGQAAYTDFGRPTQTLSGQDTRLKLTGPSVAGLLIFPLGPIDLYGKGGWISWKSDVSSGGSTSNASGTDTFYGAGLGFYLWKIGIRAEYERFQIKDIDRVEMVSLSALFQF